MYTPYMVYHTIVIFILLFKLNNLHNICELRRSFDLKTIFIIY